MKVVRFLERKEVIRFFGAALVAAPFINYLLHVLIIKYQSKIAWSQFQYYALFQQMNNISLFLAFCSVAIGAVMLSGSTKAWKFVLLLIGTHLLLQILNVGDKAWRGPLAWPSFLLNAGLFFFIFDQLVWKIKAPPNAVIKNTIKDSSESINSIADIAKVEESLLKSKSEVSPAENKSADKQTLQNAFKTEKTYINLKSYRKIYFSFGSPKPWGELKTLSSENISVKKIADVPKNIDDKIVQINFSEDVVIDIKFDRREEDVLYFKPLNMNKEKVTNLNKWLNKIAV